MGGRPRRRRRGAPRSGSPEPPARRRRTDRPRGRRLPRPRPTPAATPRHHAGGPHGDDAPPSPSSFRRPRPAATAPRHPHGRLGRPAVAFAVAVAERPPATTDGRRGRAPVPGWAGKTRRLGAAAGRGQGCRAGEEMPSGCAPYLARCAGDHVARGSASCPAGRAQERRQAARSGRAPSPSPSPEKAAKAASGQRQQLPPPPQRRPVTAPRSAAAAAATRCSAARARAPQHQRDPGGPEEARGGAVLVNGAPQTRRRPTPQSVRAWCGPRARTAAR